MTTKGLPRGVRVIGGYVQVRIMYRGRVYTKGFGPDSTVNRHFAAIHAADKYKDILRSRVGLAPEAKRIKFVEARQSFYVRHYEKYKDPETHQPRTAGAKRCAADCLKVLGKFFDGFYLDEIQVSDIKEYKTFRLESGGVANATFNRERGVLFSIFTQFKAWIDEGTISPIELPSENPCKAVPTLTANKRSRIPDTWELADAYAWCQIHDGGLWDAIEKALLTALRKQDLVALDGSLTVKGIQQKTGEKFDLPITLDKPVNLTNYRKRWDALRHALGWQTVGSPKHTTWHDLRHWAPTMLGEHGFSTKIIQNYTGHQSEASAERYTNVRKHTLAPAVDVIRQQIQCVKDEAQSKRGEA